MKGTTAARIIASIVGVALTLFVFGLVNGHCAQHQTKSSTSESTLPPRLTEIIGFNCKTEVINEKGKAPGAKAKLIVNYKDNVLDPIEFDLGFHYGKNFDTDDAELVAIKACQSLRKKIREEVAREYKQQAKSKSSP